jgi:hypothetical protein
LRALSAPARVLSLILAHAALGVGGAAVQLDAYAERAPRRRRLPLPPNRGAWGRRLPDAVANPGPAPGPQAGRGARRRHWKAGTRYNRDNGRPAVAWADYVKAGG